MGCDSSSLKEQHQIPAAVASSKHIEPQGVSSEPTVEIDQSIRGKTVWVVFECTQVHSVGSDTFKASYVFSTKEAAQKALQSMKNEHRQKNCIEKVALEKDKSSDEELFWQQKFKLWADKDCIKMLSSDQVIAKMNIFEPPKDNSLEGKTVYIVFECVGSHAGSNDHQFVDVFLDKTEAEERLKSVGGNFADKNNIVELKVEFNPDSKPLGWNAAYKAWVDDSLTTMVSLSMIESKFKSK